MGSYDERELFRRLSGLGRGEKTAFAVACAERLLPFYRRYVEASGKGDVEVMGGIVERVWGVVAGSPDDLVDAQARANGLIPDDDAPGWVPEAAFGQNAALAVAYAVDVWLSDDPQDAVWAARQVFDAAEYAGRPPVDGVVVEEAGAGDPSLSSAVVLRAVAAIDADLAEVEGYGVSRLGALRERIRREAAEA